MMILAKPHSFQYHFAGRGGSAGTMICPVCNQPVMNHAHDWVEYTKPMKDDWKFVSVHRKCYADQSGWEKIERANKRDADAHNRIMTALRKTASAFDIDDPIIFAQLAAEAIGEPDLDAYYFREYGSS
jgi:hypothetical protein